MDKIEEIKRRISQGYFLNNDLKYLINTIEQQQQEIERYKKYIMYFAGEEAANDIRLAMESSELD